MRATVLAGALSLALAVSAASTPAMAAPSQVTGVSIVVANSNIALNQGRMTVTWVAVSGATAYTVTASTGGILAASTSVTAPVTSATLTGLTGGSTYTVEVSAFDSSGYGPASAAQAAVALTVPSAPVVTSVSADTNTNTTTVNWSAPSNSGGSAITSYAISRLGGSATTVGSSSTSYAYNQAFTNPQVSDFVVTATNAVGTSASGSSSASTPSAPRNVEAVANASGVVTVSWTAPVSDGGSAITGYTVSYTPSGGSTQSLSAGASATSSTFTATSGTYAIEVNAINSIGSGLTASRSLTVTQAGGSSGSGSSGSGASGGGAASSDGAGATGGSGGSGRPTTPTNPGADGSGNQDAGAPNPPGGGSSKVPMADAAELPQRITAGTGDPVRIPITLARPISLGKLIMTITSGRGRPSRVDASFVKRGSAISARFTAPQQAGRYVVRLILMTAKGPIEVDRSVMRVR